MRKLPQTNFDEKLALIYEQRVLHKPLPLVEGMDEPGGPEDDLMGILDEVGSIEMGQLKDIAGEFLDIDGMSDGAIIMAVGDALGVDLEEREGIVYKVDDEPIDTDSGRFSREPSPASNIDKNPYPSLEDILNINIPKKHDKSERFSSSDTGYMIDLQKIMNFINSNLKSISYEEDREVLKDALDQLELSIENPQRRNAAVRDYIGRDPYSWMVIPDFWQEIAARGIDEIYVRYSDGDIISAPVLY